MARWRELDQNLEGYAARRPGTAMWRAVYACGRRSAAGGGVRTKSLGLICAAGLVAGCVSAPSDGVTEQASRDPPTPSSAETQPGAAGEGLRQDLIAFTYRDVLYVARGDGSERRVVTDFPGAPYPYAGGYWSPDGTELVVRTEAQSDTGLSGYIFRVDADGSNLLNLSKVSGSRHDAMPAWSPDGTEIVYSATKPGDQVPSLYIMGRDGSNPRKVTDLGFEAQYPSWSSADRIAFTAVKEGGFDLFSIAPDGSGLTRLTEGVGDNNWPSYSPDGSQIAFFSNRDGTDAVWVMAADGKDPRKVAEGGEPNWSPHGDWITFNCDTEEPRICAARPDGSLTVDLFDRAGFPAIRP